MSIKKSDKLIAIVGVIILIVAGIGIALYESPTDTDITIESEELLYYPVSTAEYGEMIINGNAEKTYSDTVTITGLSLGCVLTSVDFQINWEDDKTIGLINALKRGKDTLTTDITYMGETKTKSSKGSGSDTITFDINNVPSVDPIEANNETEAEDLLYEMFSGKNEACFELSVNVEVGEPIWRPLKRMLDKGNNFEIKITYNYYFIDLEEPQEPEEPDEPPIEESYKRTGYGLGRDWFGVI